MPQVEPLRLRDWPGDVRRVLRTQEALAAAEAITVAQERRDPPEALAIAQDARMQWIHVTEDDDASGTGKNNARAVGETHSQNSRLDTYGSDCLARRRSNTRYI